jgi:mannose-6-phosphate isomerase-like protein (cupin superfamily)
MSTTPTDHPIVLPAELVALIPSRQLGDLIGVTHRVLWSDSTSMAGVLTVVGGHRLGVHSHRINEHHLWVIDGGAAVLGAHVGPGSYVHVPAGVEHDIDASRTDGCTVFYLYIKPSP